MPGAVTRSELQRVSDASVGTGSNNHYDTEAFAKWAGIELVHLPNKGGGGAMTNDLLTGNAHVALVNAASALGVIKAGEVRAFAIMSDRRVPELPDVPTLLELGYPNAKGLWSALYAPSATPRDVLETVFWTTTHALRPPRLEGVTRASGGPLAALHGLEDEPPGPGGPAFGARAAPAGRGA